MANRHLSRKSRQALIVSGVSVALIAFLIRAVDWKDAYRILQGGISPGMLWPFLLMTIAIALAYGYRWRLLLKFRLDNKASLIVSTLCLGGNMLLPARGGDLLRIHYSHLATGMPHAEILSRLLVEKVIDLVTIAAVGALASVSQGASSVSAPHSILTIFTVTALMLALFVMAMIKYFSEPFLLCLRHVFNCIRRQGFFEKHVTYLVGDIRRSLAISVMFLPGALTLVLWVSVYAFSYIFAARFVGVVLSYQESLLVLFAGAVGLMLPAAPSGIGTFHASIVSAFIYLGRSPAEGLLVATAVHFLFFVAYVVPAGFLYGRWYITRNIPR
ncbi:lysylphosphatidylglycerol synthase transmembrane domain-containing protein [Nitratidesulfovibrio liaohensis]|uniref:Flippase-like domain-containing protein n=1 Tax=Nitratidesulfovibrio liaohensis TaxID=2604158 RepID=A0ABY9R553_9BACT|nr:lysylphosphatidylglycerol synthase transmembrane domain-containing protein [Nitratidesulfovibrio liaohensis]WMW66267.1 flippase-like domain-containing protein [Nitratidesulfovibrio liaohensis]